MYTVETPPPSHADVTAFHTSRKPIIDRGVAAGKEGELRLVRRTDATDSTSGDIEIFHAGAWGAFCETSSSTVTTKVRGVHKPA